MLNGRHLLGRHARLNGVLTCKNARFGERKPPRYALSITGARSGHDHARPITLVDVVTVPRQ